MPESLEDLESQLQTMSPEEQENYLFSLKAKAEADLNSYPFQSPSPLRSSSSSPRGAPTGYTGNSGAETASESPQESISSTSASADESLLEGLDELRQPLTGKHKKQQREIEELFGLVGGVLFLVGRTSNNTALLKDVETIGKYGQDVAESWAKLARKYPWLYEALDRGLGYTAVGLMLASTTQMMQELMSNHGIKLPGLPGRRGNMAPGTLAGAHAA